MDSRRWLIQWRTSRLGCCYFARNFLGLPCLQCTCRGYLGLRMNFLLRVASVFYQLTNGSQWQYFVPIQERLPQNCSTDLVNVIDYIDSVLLGSNETAIQNLKDSFLLGDLRNDDFAEYGLPPERNNLAA